MRVRSPVPTTPPAPGTPSRTEIPRVIRWRARCGLRVVAIPSPALPVVSVRLVLPSAGASADPADAPGTASLVTALIGEGTQEHDPDTLNEIIDALGVALEAHASHDVAEVSLSSLPEVLDEALPLLAEVAGSPSFPDDQVDRARGEVLDALAARSDDPGTVADDTAAASVFGLDHPYGRPVDGTPEGVAGLTPSDLRGFHAARYRPEGAVLLVAGPVEEPLLRPLVDRAFAGWSGSAPAPVAPDAGRTEGRELRREWTGGQAEIRLATAGIPRTSDRWISAAVTNYLLGGSTITGRLGANLREEKGWTYGAGSAFNPARGSGIWMASTAVEASVANEAVREMMEEVRRLGSEPVTAYELRTAQDALVLSLARAFETVEARTARFASVDVFGLEEDYWERLTDNVRAVSPTEVRETARTLLGPDRLVRVVVGAPG